MIATDVLLLFVAASAALAIAPGPDNLYVLTQSAVHGRRTGLMITLGLCSGLLVHIAAVALGVATLLKASPVAFTVLKWAGAVYLLYLAWLSFRASSSEIGQAAASPLRKGALYARGVVMNVSNPKVAIFFLAFLPQFADPTRSSMTSQIVMLGALFMATAFVVFCAVAWAADRIGHWLRSSATAQTVINRVAGAVLALLALRLLFGAP